MKKNRECMYCKRFFDCRERDDVDFCISFAPRSEEAKKNYEEWAKNTERKQKR